MVLISRLHQTVLWLSLGYPCPAVDLLTMEEFSTLKELEDYIDRYETENNVRLYKDGAKLTSTTVKKQIPERLKNVNHELKYYNLYLRCFRGGPKFKSKGKGLGKAPVSVKQDCRMFIRVVLTEDGQKLRVKAKNETHNHPPEDTDFFRVLFSGEHTRSKNLSNLVKNRDATDNLSQSLGESDQSALRESKESSSDYEDHFCLVESTPKQIQAKETIPYAEKLRIATSKLQEVANVMARFSDEDFEKSCIDIDSLAINWGHKYVSLCNLKNALNDVLNNYL